MKDLGIINDRDEQGDQAHATRNALGMVFPMLGIMDGVACGMGIP
jgi:hypothetical protein